MSDEVRKELNASEKHLDKAKELPHGQPATRPEQPAPEDMADYNEDQARSEVAETQAQVQADDDFNLDEPKLSVGTEQVDNLASVIQPPSAESTTDPTAASAQRKDEPFDLAEGGMADDDTSPDIAKPLADQPAAAAAEAPSPERKKKPRSPKPFNWGKFLKGIGGEVGNLGGAIGSPHLAKMGGLIQGAGSMVKMIDMLSAGFGQEGKAGGAGPAGADGGAAEAAKVLTGSEGAGTAADNDITSVIPELASSAQGGGQTERQSQEGQGELNTVFRELLEAIRKLTEEMQKGSKKPGDQNDFMPEGGSFGGGSRIMGGIAESLGLSPGELQLIITMFRLAMTA